LTGVLASSASGSFGLGVGLGSGWDTDKVLEGKAVFRIIDVDPLPPASAVASSLPMTTGQEWDRE